MFQYNVRAVFSGITKIINNTGLRGILTAYNQASFAFLGHSYFENNRRGLAGTLTLISTSTPSMISGKAEFIDNDSGILMLSSDIILEGNFQFQHNKGGTGCINLFQSNILINGTVIMRENTATIGPAINSFQSIIQIIGDHFFIQNIAESDGGSIFAEETIIHFNTANCTFASNVANRGGALYAVNSQIYLTGHHEFIYNKSRRGWGNCLRSTFSTTLQ